MNEFLKSRIPEQTWENRLVCENGLCYLEFNALDVDRLARLDIEVDNLGPYLVVCMWEDQSELEVGGYLVVDNLAMGRPSMGGIRMIPELVPSNIYNLARGMTLKNAAAGLPFGGGKSGIVADSHPGTQEHEKRIDGFARLIRRYQEIYLPGPDVGTNDSDMKTIAIRNGIDQALSKPVEMGGNRIDELGAAAGGTIVALQALLEQMPKLKNLPQFAQMQIPDEKDLEVLIQGFGAVGAHAARILKKRMPDAKVTGISDISGYLFSKDGLPVQELFETWKSGKNAGKKYFDDHFADQERCSKSIKYSTSCDDLLRESAFCVIPASPIANYLDVTETTDPSITTREMGEWRVVIEGANTYSPIQKRKVARARLEREIYSNRGILVATDYLVNSGGVIYAAQEKLIETPPEIRIPVGYKGNRMQTEEWLTENADAFEKLAAERREAARNYREKIISLNMVELVDLLINDEDLIPAEAAEKISVSRMALSESGRHVREIMTEVPTVETGCSVKDAADILTSEISPIIVVTSEEGFIRGVLTTWDITKSVLEGSPEELAVEKIMSREVISASPEETLVDVIRKLENYEISAMPVVSKQKALGLVSSDILARRSLLRMLQTSVG
jgi:glutamate dehydrogenase (NAD(P)+)